MELKAKQEENGTFANTLLCVTLFCEFLAIL